MDDSLHFARHKSEIITQHVRTIMTNKTRYQLPTQVVNLPRNLLDRIIFASYFIDVPVVVMGIRCYTKSFCSRKLSVHICVLYMDFRRSANICANLHCNPSEMSTRITANHLFIGELAIVTVTTARKHRVTENSNPNPNGNPSPNSSANPNSKS